MLSPNACFKVPAKLGFFRANRSSAQYSLKVISSATCMT